MRDIDGADVDQGFNFAPKQDFALQPQEATAVSQVIDGRKISIQRTPFRKMLQIEEVQRTALQKETRKERIQRVVDRISDNMVDGKGYSEADVYFKEVKERCMLDSDSNSEEENGQRRTKALGKWSDEDLTQTAQEFKETQKTRASKHENEVMLRRLDHKTADAIMRQERRNSLLADLRHGQPKHSPNQTALVPKSWWHKRKRTRTSQSQIQKMKKFWQP